MGILVYRIPPDGDAEEDDLQRRKQEDEEELPKTNSKNITTQFPSFYLSTHDMFLLILMKFFDMSAHTFLGYGVVHWQQPGLVTEEEEERLWLRRRKDWRLTWDNK